MSSKTLIKILSISGFIIVCLGAGYLGYEAYGKYHEKLMNKYNDVAAQSYELGYQEGYLAGNKDKVTQCNYQNILNSLDYHHVTTKNTAEGYIFTEARLERIMNKSNPNLSAAKKEKYKKYILKWSDEYGLSPVFVAAMIHRETNFRENAVSSAKAKGALQVVPKWHSDKLKILGIKEDDLHSINHGIRVGCWVIRDYLEATGWDYKKALTKYVGAVKNKQTAESYIKDIFDMTLYAYSTDIEQS